MRLRDVVGLREYLVGGALAVVFVASVVGMLVIGHRHRNRALVAANDESAAAAAVPDLPAPQPEPIRPAEPAAQPQAPPAAKPIMPLAPPDEEEPPPARPPGNQLAAAPVQPANQPAAQAPAANLDPAKLVAMVEPAVVKIDVKDKNGNDDGGGSGFVVGANTVVTNLHVVEGAGTAQITFPSGATANVTGFVAVLPGCDLALLAANLPVGTPSLQLTKAPPAKGEDVRAFGTPNGLQWSVTRGIVSALRSGDEVRNVFGRDVYDAAGYDRATKWVQTDAGINKGNSGGPPVNVRGEVVGVNTLKKSFDPVQKEILQNLNFAVDASEVRRLITLAKQPQPLAALPVRKAAIAGRPPIPPGGNFPDRVQAAIAVIDRERIILFVQKAEVDAKIADLEREIIRAKSEFDGLSGQVAAVRQQYRRLQGQDAQIQQKMMFERSLTLRAQYEAERRALAADAAAVEATGNRLAALQQEAQTRGRALQSSQQFAVLELAALYGEAHALS